MTIMKDQYEFKTMQEWHTRKTKDSTFKKIHHFNINLSSASGNNEAKKCHAPLTART